MAERKTTFLGGRVHAASMREHTLTHWQTPTHTCWLDLFRTSTQTDSPQMKRTAGGSTDCTEISGDAIRGNRHTKTGTLLMLPSTNTSIFVMWQPCEMLLNFNTTRTKAWVKSEVSGHPMSHGDLSPGKSEMGVIPEFIYLLLIAQSLSFLLQHCWCCF